MEKYLIVVLSHRDFKKKSLLMENLQSTENYDAEVWYQDEGFYTRNKYKWHESVHVNYEEGSTQGDNREHSMKHWGSYSYIVTLDDDFKSLKKVFNEDGKITLESYSGKMVERRKKSFNNLIEFVEGSIMAMENSDICLIAPQKPYFPYDPNKGIVVQSAYGTALGVWNSSAAITAFNYALSNKYTRMHGDDNILNEYMYVNNITTAEDKRYAVSFGWGKDDVSSIRPQNTFDKLSLYDAVLLEHLFPGRNKYFLSRNGNTIHSHKRKETDKELIPIIFEKKVPVFPGLEKYYDALMEDLSNEDRVYL